MIGNQNDARLALHAAEVGDYTYLLSNEGTTRYAFLINGVVYKVEYSGDYWSANRSEYNNAARLRTTLPEGFSVPEVEMYGDVLAMEYVEGRPTGECIAAYVGEPCDCDSECMDPLVLDDLANLGWMDPAWGNAIVEWETGLTYLIDVA